LAVLTLAAVMGWRRLIRTAPAGRRCTRLNGAGRTGDDLGRMLAWPGCSGRMRGRGFCWMRRRAWTAAGGRACRRPVVAAT